MAAPREPALPALHLAGAGLPALPMAMVLIAAYVYLPTFYARQFGLDLAAIGVILFVTRIADMISDPLVGALSDRWTTRWGRRRPWIALGVPLTAVSLAFLMSPPGAVGQGHLLFWALVLTLGWTFITVPLSAWGAELSDYYHQRSRVAAVRNAFGIVGTLAAILIAALPGLDPRVDQAMAMAWLGWAVAVLLPLGVLFLLIAVPERRLAPAAATPWREGLRVLAGNAPLRRLLLAGFVNAVANGLPGTLFLLFAAHVVKMDAAQSGGALLFYFGAAFVSLPLWLRLSYRIGKHRAWTVAMLAAALAFVTVLFAGPGDFWLFVGMSVATGLALGGDLVFPAAIQADVVDADRAAGGAQRAGLILALNQMAAKLGLALAVLVAFPLLALAGFDAQNPQGERGLWALAALYAALPIVLKLAAVALVRRFPLGVSEQAVLRAALARKSAVGPDA
jgi:Na+/melibiose symporter-like transporter